jgi:DNA helicase II / ATP-dependent DNA helicase PcrA
MDALESARQSAAALHAIAVKSGANPEEPLELVEHAVRHLGLDLFWLSESDPLLKGARALFDEQGGIICCVSDGDVGTRSIFASHEIGHARLHARSAECLSEDIDPTRSDEKAPVGLQRVEDYGVRERREQQADIFAREFLLPREVARRRHLTGETASEISGAMSLPLGLVRQQLYDALLIPRAPTGSPSRTFTPSQTWNRITISPRCSAELLCASTRRGAGSR